MSQRSVYMHVIRCSIYTHMLTKRLRFSVFKRGKSISRYFLFVHRLLFPLFHCDRSFRLKMLCLCASNMTIITS